MPVPTAQTTEKQKNARRRGFPVPYWMRNYRRSYLPNDFIAGLTVAIMLIPQGMAYAVLAGLPPVVGLYGGILPGIVYGLLGSSRVLTVGPTAITSVMILGSIGGLAPLGSDAYWTLALSLALALGIVYLLMGLLRLGFIVKLLSQPVLSGYVNAAALVILLSQIQNILGISVGTTRTPLELAFEIIQNIMQTNLTTLAVGVLSIGFLLFFRGPLQRRLDRLSFLPRLLKNALARSGPLVLVLVSTLLVAATRVDTSAGVSIIGDIPTGLPPFTFQFDFTHWDSLLLGAVAIAFVGFMEGMSTVKSLVSKKRIRISANRELMAMGAANVSAAFTGGLPVTTSISRSAVNFATGAQSGLSSIVASSFLLLTVLYFTPLFYYLPTAALAAIIIVAVINLIDFTSIQQIYRYNPLEALPFIVTFVGVFVINIAGGILGGIITSAALHLWRASRPQFTPLGRLPDSDRYVDARHNETELPSHTLIVRVDESLYFANAQTLEEYLRNAIAEREDVTHIILVCNAINNIDASAMQILGEMIREFKRARVEIYLAEMKEMLMERLERVHFVDNVGRNRFFRTTQHAVEAADVDFYDFKWPI